jgi:hypothetical protein
MTRLIQITALLGLVLTTGAAQAAVSSRAECYDVVIAHCNATAGDHAQECAKGGMDQCDAQFPKFELPPTRKLGFKAN